MRSSQFSEAAWLCDPTVEAFNIALRGCLAGEGPDRATRLALAHEHTYKRPHPTDAPNTGVHVMTTKGLSVITVCMNRQQHLQLNGCPRG